MKAGHLPVEIAQQSNAQHVSNRIGQIVFLALMTLAFLFCALDGFKQSFLGGVFTRGIGVFGLILSVFGLTILSFEKNETVHGLI